MPSIYVSRISPDFNTELSRKQCFRCIDNLFANSKSFITRKNLYRCIEYWYFSQQVFLLSSHCCQGYSVTSFNMRKWLYTVIEWQYPKFLWPPGIWPTVSLASPHVWAPQHVWARMLSMVEIEGRQDGLWVKGRFWIKRFRERWKMAER